MTLKQIKKEDYDFFDSIERYIKDGKSIEDTIDIDPSSTDCNSFSEYWGNRSRNTEMAKHICIKLISIYKELKNGNRNYSSDDNYKKDFAFLTYWLNWKIYGENNENISVTNFYDHIGSHAPADLSYELINTHIFKIQRDELNKMNILYSLYENYSKLNYIIEKKFDDNKQSLSTLLTACCPDYIQASYICNPGNNDSTFCTKLKTFESIYEKLYEKLEQKGSDYSKNFIKLSECPNTKIITTAVTGSIVGLIPLFGILYKFTPMGQMFRSKTGILNNGIINNDKEMTKMSLMEQENEPLKFQQGTYNIKYQSL